MQQNQSNYEENEEFFAELEVEINRLKAENKSLLTACESALDYGDPKNIVDAELARVAIYNILKTAIRTAKGEK